MKTTRRRLTRAIIDALAILANRPYRCYWSIYCPHAGTLGAAASGYCYARTEDQARINANLAALAHLGKGEEYDVWRHMLASGAAFKKAHFIDRQAPCPFWVFRLGEKLHRDRFLQY